MKRRLLLVLALAQQACGEAAPQQEGPATLELGTGSWRFEPLEDGQEVELVHGAQGGWHLWISLRVRHADVDHPLVQLSIEPADQSLPAQEESIALPFDAKDEHDARKLIGYTGVISAPSCWVGALVRVAATLTTDDGTVLRDERDVVVRGGVYPPPPCAAP